MRIAVTYNNGEVFQHFGHSEYFKVYEVEDGKVSPASLPAKASMSSSAAVSAAVQSTL